MDAVLLKIKTKILTVWFAISDHNRNFSAVY
jgi:hypothetical protein